MPPQGSLCGCEGSGRRLLEGAEPSPADAGGWAGGRQAIDKTASSQLAGNIHQLPFAGSASQRDKRNEIQTGGEDGAGPPHETDPLSVQRVALLAVMLLPDRAESTDRGHHRAAEKETGPCHIGDCGDLGLAPLASGWDLCPICHERHHHAVLHLQMPHPSDQEGD